MTDPLEKFFSEKLLAPVREWQKEAETNKEFYLGEKTFEYVKTMTGDEPIRCWFCDERMDYCQCEDGLE